ncbi:MAG: ATP-binding cassette domain-containing protein, partial [Candidatus Eisenbacteria bacterium]
MNRGSIEPRAGPDLGPFLGGAEPRPRAFARLASLRRPVSGSLLETRSGSCLRAPRESRYGLDVRIERGEIFGLLGPNGAGKTTFIKILTTLLFPTSGEAWVAGRDAVREPNEVRRRISLVSGGETS